jgi:hypothetical protein
MDWDPRLWSLPVWILYGIGVLYVAGFVTFFFRIERSAKAARAGDPESVRKYNAGLKGFPNSLYARMLGKRPLELD